MHIYVNVNYVTFTTMTLCVPPSVCNTNQATRLLPKILSSCVNVSHGNCHIKAKRQTKCHAMQDDVLCTLLCKPLLWQYFVLLLSHTAGVEIHEHWSCSILVDVVVVYPHLPALWEVPAPSTEGTGSTVFCSHQDLGVMVSSFFSFFLLGRFYWKSAKKKAN